MIKIPKLTLTDAGKILIAACMQGSDMVFTRIKLGDGVPSSSSAALTDLVHPVLSVSFESSIPGTRYVTLTGSFDNSSLADPLTVREVGIFARDENQNEILYAYASETEDPTVIPTYPVSGYMSETLTFIVAIGDAVNVNVDIGDGLSQSRIATGSYIGGGPGTQIITTGFTPRAVIVNAAKKDPSHLSDVYGGVAVTGVNVVSPSGDAASIKNWDSMYTAIMIVDRGFKVNFNSTYGVRTNENGCYYSYIAFK